MVNNWQVEYFNSGWMWWTYNYLFFPNIWDKMVSTPVITAETGVITFPYFKCRFINMSSGDYFDCLPHSSFIPPNYSAGWTERYGIQLWFKVFNNKAVDDPSPSPAQAEDLSDGQLDFGYNKASRTSHSWEVQLIECTDVTNLSQYTYNVALLGSGSMYFEDKENKIYKEYAYGNYYDDNIYLWQDHNKLKSYRSPLPPIDQP